VILKDVLIENEIIVEIAESISAQSDCKIIDAEEIFNSWSN
jgi:dihydroorotase-like cyclic amidohydrolase